MEPQIVHTTVAPGKNASFSHRPFLPPNSTPAQLPETPKRYRSQPTIFV